MLNNKVIHTYNIKFLKNTGHDAKKLLKFFLHHVLRYRHIKLLTREVIGWIEFVLRTKRVSTFSVIYCLPHFIWTLLVQWEDYRLAGNRQPAYLFLVFLYRNWICIYWIIFLSCDVFRDVRYIFLLATQPRFTRVLSVV